MKNFTHFTTKDILALEYAEAQLRDECECGSESEKSWEMLEAIEDLLKRARAFKTSNKRKLLFTPQQVNFLFEQLRDCDSMLGGGEFESDRIWGSRIKALDRMFAANGLPKIQD